VERFSHRERRFLATGGQAASIRESALRNLHLAVYDPDRPLAYARTLYLDGPAVDPGTRLRIRQYAAASQPGEPARATCSYLEYKRHDGEQRHKVRVTAPAHALSDLLAGRMIEDWRARLHLVPELRDVVPALLRGALAPRLTTWYRRVTLAGSGLRMTLDQQVGFSLPEPPAAEGAAAAPGEMFAQLPGVIVEIKSAGDLPAWLAHAVACLPPAPRSKFEAGLAALGEPGGARRVA
jgi:VTC domain-containing protein